MIASNLRHAVIAIAAYQPCSIDTVATEIEQQGSVEHGSVADAIVLVGFLIDNGLTEVEEGFWETTPSRTGALSLYLAGDLEETLEWIDEHVVNP